MRFLVQPEKKAALNRFCSGDEKDPRLYEETHELYYRRNKKLQKKGILKNLNQIIKCNVPQMNWCCVDLGLEVSETVF